MHYQIMIISFRYKCHSSVRMWPDDTKTRVATEMGIPFLENTDSYQQFPVWLLIVADKRGCERMNSSADFSSSKITLLHLHFTACIMTTIGYPHPLPYFRKPFASSFIISFSSHQSSGLLRFGPSEASLLLPSP